MKSGQDLWSVELVSGDGEQNFKLWRDFQNLHMKSAGRETRSSKTWDLLSINNGKTCCIDLLVGCKPRSRWRWVFHILTK